MDAQQEKILDTLDKLLIKHMTFYVDWAKLNSASPDFEAGYIPDYPIEVAEATRALVALREIFEKK